MMGKTIYWTKHGRVEGQYDVKNLHRKGSPAIEYANGSKAWYINGKLHREDGPSIENANGDKEWHINGKLHRENGPAIESTSGMKQWWIDGRVHREDGPAIIWIYTPREWWINGNPLPRQEIEDWLIENDIDLTTDAGKMAFKLRWVE